MGLLLLSRRGALVNLPPQVDVGPDLEAVLNVPFVIEATVIDWTIPEGGALTMVWTKTSGPGKGAVIFTPVDGPVTSVVASKPGVYVLRLTASDGELLAYDELRVMVAPKNLWADPPVADPAEANLWH
jgi:hypothetical protein